jgi:hypothetical protein
MLTKPGIYIIIWCEKSGKSFPDGQGVPIHMLATALAERLRVARIIKVGACWEITSYKSQITYKSQSQNYKRARPCILWYLYPDKKLFFCIFCLISSTFLK